ncbi:MAG TPA: ERCC4 domain-containing protein [bacterium]|nr:ERCC4 domain-containing protein [bacterium]
MNTPTIIIDTREQIPYEFQGVMTERRALPAGDYSVEGMETSIAVERKSLDDFVKSVISDRRRFGLELTKLAEYAHSCVVVEGNLSDILSGSYRSGAHPASVFGALISIVVNKGIPVIPCSNRQIARAFTEHFLIAAAECLRKTIGPERRRKDRTEPETAETGCKAKERQTKAAHGAGGETEHSH